ncbi:MAG TPA: serine hydrolase domain-containing protein [Candidatus Krumholzibacteria bacterium]|nr:serine hydrolase domain-containing protein [Candidatus Krumholzibacteria bacterium]HPD72193.1 serine hydrolase domain-containing protein [Candidatus Krumholzibacteria bacterium]HRY40875.1 serine hydrolase domain-containing protein [Candidatus Krumholzibacteria bacterium]
MNRHFGLSLALGAWLAGSATAADPGTLARDLQAVVAQYLAENPLAPGVVAHVEAPGVDLVWTGAAGAEAHGSTVPLTPDHTFRIASNTKTYVAAAVLRLAEQGRLSLDDLLGRYLSADQRALLAGDRYDLDAITLRHVLSHTAGLGDHTADPRFAEAILADPQHEWTPAEDLRLCVEWQDPVGAPGERFVYSDTGYVLLGGVVERVAGRGLGPAVRELLDFASLDLDATWWEVAETPPRAAGPRAHQYFGELDTTDWNPSLDLYGGGGLVSDARDLAVFMRALLGGRVLREASSLAAMTGGGTATYRLGLMCVDLDGHLAWGHQGFWNTFAFHVPALDVTVAGSILNHDAQNGRELARRLVAVLAAALPGRS